MTTPSSLRINLPPTFANSFWSSPDYRIGVEALYSRLQSGLDENANVLALVEHRAALEYSHAEQLATPCPLPTYTSPLFKNALREGTSKNARSFAASASSASHALRAIEAESIQVQAAAHGKVARALEKSILIPFGKWSQEHQSKVQNSWEYLDANLQRFEKQKADVDRMRNHYETKCRQADEAEDDARFAGGELTSPTPTDSDAETMQEKQQQSFTESMKSNESTTSSLDEAGKAPPLDVDLLKRRETLRQQFGFRRSAGADNDKYTSTTPRSVSAEAAPTQNADKDESTGVKRSSTLSSALSSALHKASEVPALQNLRAAVGVLNEPKHLRLRKEAENAEVSYKDAVRALDKLRCEVEEILMEHFSLTERWEMGRLVAMKRVLTAFNTAFITLLPTTSASFQRISALDSGLDIDKSLTHLIVDARTGPYQPYPQVFIPYYHDDPSSLSAGAAGFGMDLSAFMRAETLASESGVVSGEIRAGAGESYKVGMPAIPLALMVLLASLERMYDDASRWPVSKEEKVDSSPVLVNGEKRKAWIYEVPLVNIHLCREAIISHLLGNSVPGADVGAGLDTKLKRFDPPTLASTAKIWAMELSDSLISSTLWDSVDNTYRAAADQEYDSRATPSKTVGEARNDGGKVSEESTTKGKGRAEGHDPVLEETIRKGVLADLSVILSKLPKIHLVCLDAIIGHLARLIKTTPVEESDSIYLNKLGLALGRVLIRPSVETSSTLRSRAPILLAHDLIKYYDNLLPPLLAKKAKESEAALLSQRRTPIRKRTKPIDQRMSRTRLAASSSGVPLPVVKDEAIPHKLETKLLSQKEDDDDDDDDSITPIGSRILGKPPIVEKKQEEVPSRIKSPMSTTSSSAYGTPDEADEKATSIKSSSSSSPVIVPSTTIPSSGIASYDDDKRLSNVARLSRHFGSSSGNVKSGVRGPRAAAGSSIKQPPTKEA